MPGYEWDTTSPPLILPLQIEPLGKFDYSPPKSTFSVWSLLGNPMLLMALVSLGAIFIMPKLMDNMDEETRAEFQKQQASQAAMEMPNIADQLANWLAPKDAPAAVKGSTSPKKRNPN